MKLYVSYGYDKWPDAAASDSSVRNRETTDLEYSSACYVVYLPNVKM